MRLVTAAISSFRSNAVAYVALFVALGGSSLATIELPRGSVGTAQLRAGAVTNDKIRSHSLRAQAFAPGVIPKEASTARLHTVVVFGPNPPLPPSCGIGGCPQSSRGSSITSVAVCPAGEQVLGGGYKMSSENPAGGEIVTASVPAVNQKAQGWAVTFELTEDGYLFSFDNQAWAVCASSA
jgi:hypothetical protein